MTKQIMIHNVETGEQIVRDMTTEELAEYDLGATARAEREVADAQAKAAKMEILAALGLTEDQAKVLGLIPSETTPL